MSLSLVAREQILLNMSMEWPLCTEGHGAWLRGSKGKRTLALNFKHMSQPLRMSILDNDGYIHGLGWSLSAYSSCSGCLASVYFCFHKLQQHIQEHMHSHGTLTEQGAFVHGNMCSRNRVDAEANKLADLHHPNVVAFYGVARNGPSGSLATVTEYMVNGSLRTVLQENDKNLDMGNRLLIAKDIAYVMEYLHGNKIVHFDLKSDNLLVNLLNSNQPVCKVTYMELPESMSRVSEVISNQEDI